MANKKLGYIKLYRSLQEHWLWCANTKFDERSAWVDLLMLVNHKKKKIVVKGHLQVVNPGQKWTSYRFLAERWHWSTGKVKRYTQLLKSDGMIYTDETENGTLLTIVNWGDFANTRHTDEDTDEDTDRDTTEDTDGDTDEDRTRMNKNVKNDKELKEEGRDSLPPPTRGGVWQ